MTEPEISLQVDAVGLPCPMPLLKAKQAMHQLQAGQRLELRATDPGSCRDIPSWCRLAGHQLLSQTDQTPFVFVIEKAG